MKRPRTETIRYPAVDYYRGFAILNMMVFHFCYLLADAGLWHTDFYSSPFWLNYRLFIVSSFLIVMGVSVQLSLAHGLKWKRYRARLGRIAGCAGVISVGSYFLFGPRWIFFGILHFAAAASLAALLFHSFYGLNLILGVGLTYLGATYQNVLFNGRLLQWFGLMTYKPPTEDYVPFLPWFGVVLIGMFLGTWLLRQPPNNFFQREIKNPAARILGLGGQHSLLIYMVHPALFAAFVFVLAKALP